MAGSAGATQSGRNAGRKKGALSTRPGTTAAPAKTLARKAGQTGRAIGKAGTRMSKPIVRSIQQEEPKTLAKMVVAAVAPRLVESALRFALRRPATMLIGVAIVSAMVWATNEQE